MCWRKLFKSGLEKPPTLEAYDSYVRQQVGNLLILQIPWQDVVNDLESRGIHCMIKDDAPDYYIRYVEESDLIKILPYLIFSAHYYAEEGADCDDYTEWAGANASRIFKVNGVLRCYGDVDNEQAKGPHAWSLSVTGVKRYRFFEPNAGFEYAGQLFNAGDYGCTPKKWK